MKNQGTTERLKELLPQIFSSDRATGERYLLFEITSELTAAVNLDQVWEATVLPADMITPIPLMPSWVIGWNSGRDRVYSLVDLASLLGLENSLTVPQKYSTLVVQASPFRKTSSRETNSLLLGLAVTRILRTITIDEEVIRSDVGEFPNHLIPYIQGYWQQQQQAIPILNLTAVTEKMATIPQSSN